MAVTTLVVVIKKFNIILWKNKKWSEQKYEHNNKRKGRHHHAERTFTVFRHLEWVITSPTRPISWFWNNCIRTVNLIVIIVRTHTKMYTKSAFAPIVAIYGLESDIAVIIPKTILIILNFHLQRSLGQLYRFYSYMIPVRMYINCLWLFRIPVWTCCFSWLPFASIFGVFIRYIIHLAWSPSISKVNPNTFWSYI